MKYGDYILYFKLDKSSTRTKVIASSILSVFMIIVLLGLIWFVGGQNSRFKVTEAEIQKQAAFVNDYKAQENEFYERYRVQPKPISRNEIDLIQNSILRQAKDYRLNVSTLSSIPNPTNNPEPLIGQEFELLVSGSWDMTARFIEGFQKNNALISIRSLRVETDNNQVKTMIKYKVYFVEG